MKALLFYIILIPLSAYSVEFYRINPDASAIKISGDSSLHEWEMEAKEFTGIASVVINSRSSVELKDFELKVKSDKIKSQSDSMDKSAHETLKSNKYPYITFNLDKKLVINKKNSPGDGKVSGKISIAGATRSVQLIGTFEINENSIRVYGLHKLKMSDYKLSPPQVLFFKTKDDITVNYNLIFELETP